MNQVGVVPLSSSRSDPAVHTSRSLARDGVDCALGRPRSEALQTCDVEEVKAQAEGGEGERQKEKAPLERRVGLDAADSPYYCCMTGTNSRRGRGGAVRIRRAGLLASRNHGD
jgi:hypothetical protein